MRGSVFNVFAGLPSLDHETFRSIKPGLSAYADEPEEVRLPLHLLHTPRLVGTRAGALSNISEIKLYLPICFISGVNTFLGSSLLANSGRRLLAVADLSKRWNTIRGHLKSNLLFIYLFSGSNFRKV